VGDEKWQGSCEMIGNYKGIIWSREKWTMDLILLKKWCVGWRQASVAEAVVAKGKDLHES
jgi:hypothetical protein